MAKRRHNSARGGLARFGYPTEAELRQQARQLANASLPSVQTISHPFTQQIHDVAGFTSALADLVAQAQGGVKTAYQQAQDQQTQINQAAQARLSGLGAAYTPGVQAAQGGISDSASSRLIASGAAAQSAAAVQPGIATARGALQRGALANALDQALAQRQDAYRGAFTQAHQQLAQNAYTQAMGMANLDLSRQQLAFQRQSLNASNANAAASLQERQAEFTQRMIAEYGYDPTTGKYVQNHGGTNTTTSLAQKYKMSTTEVVNLQQHTNTQVANLIAHGYSWQKALQTANNNVPPEFAHLALMAFASSPPPYGSFHPKPTPADFTSGGVTNTPMLQRATADWTRQATNYQNRVDALQKLLSNASNAKSPFFQWLQQLGQTTGVNFGPVKGPRRSGQATGPGSTGYPYGGYNPPTFP